jgi:hypothetical protein
VQHSSSSSIDNSSSSSSIDNSSSSSSSNTSSSSSSSSSSVGSISSSDISTVQTPNFDYLSDESDDDDICPGYQGLIGPPAPPIKPLSTVSKDDKLRKNMFLYVWFAKRHGKVGIASGSLTNFRSGLTRNVPDLAELWRLLLPPISRKDARRAESHVLRNLDKLQTSQLSQLRRNLSSAEFIERCKTIRTSEVDFMMAVDRMSTSSTSSNENVCERLSRLFKEAKSHEECLAILDSLHEASATTENRDKEIIEDVNKCLRDFFRDSTLKMVNVTNMIKTADKDSYDQHAKQADYNSVEEEEDGEEEDGEEEDGEEEDGEGDFLVMKGFKGDKNYRKAEDIGHRPSFELKAALQQEESIRDSEAADQEESNADQHEIAARWSEKTRLAVAKSLSNLVGCKQVNKERQPTTLVFFVCGIGKGISNFVLLLNQIFAHLKTCSCAAKFYVIDKDERTLKAAAKYATNHSALKEFRQHVHFVNKNIFEPLLFTDSWKGVYFDVVMTTMRGMVPLFYQKLAMLAISAFSSHFVAPFSSGKTILMSTLGNSKDACELKHLVALRSGSKKDYGFKTRDLGSLFIR